ncbi:hypothetical protein F4680DRAFT_422870 [Xylaria scruposa]|nr:hypothetical protein F4680DRAFT_422870 [Xylaria scruposa]
MEATPPKGPSERLKDLTDRVQGVEAVFKAKIASKSGSSDPQHFLRTYTETIDAMELIRAESYKDDADAKLKPDLDSLFQRVMKLLSTAVRHVYFVREKLTPVHKELLKLVLRINNTPDINNDGLTRHQIEMGDRLTKIRPPAEEAWTDDGQNLLHNHEFNRKYKEFCNLKRDARIAQTRHEMYATRSWQLLQSAFRELDIPVIKIYPTGDFFDNDTRWTFLDYPYGSHEYLYGKGRRPGMIALKEVLGGTATDAETKKGFVTAYTKRNTKEMFEPASKPIEESKEQDKEKSPPNKNKRNSTDDVSPKPKKPRTGSSEGYTMNIVNAAADIEDCLRDSKFTSVQEDDVDRPGSERLQTPTVETRRTTLVAYHEDLISIIDQVYKRRFGLPTSRSKLPQTAAARGAWLTLAKKELVSARAAVSSFIDSATTPAKAKKLRLAAYKLKLVRAMYTAGLLSGEPAASAEDIQEGLIGRLDDWILHEEAWNVAEKTILGRSAITQDTYDLINGQIDERDANIARWKGLRDEVEKGPGGGDDDEPVPGLDIFIDEDDKKPPPPYKGGEGQEEYEFNEDEINADDDLEVKKPDDTETVSTSDPEVQNDEVKGEGSGAKVQEEDEETQKKKKGKGKEPEDPYANVLVDQEIKNGRILLNNVLFPKRPDAGPYLLDWREERRRRTWYEKAAQAKLAGKSTPPWNHLPPADIFEAGGPPGYDKNPRKTRWQRLQYMIVLTYWRFYQLRLLEP